MRHDLRWIDGEWVYVFRCPCGKRKRIAQDSMPHRCVCGRTFDIDRVGT